MVEEERYEEILEELDEFDSVEEKREYLLNLSKEDKECIIDEWCSEYAIYGYMISNDSYGNLIVARIDEMDVYEADDEAAQYCLNDNNLDNLINEAKEGSNLNKNGIKMLKELKRNLTELNINCSSKEFF